MWLCRWPTPLLHVKKWDLDVCCSLVWFSDAEIKPQLCVAAVSHNFCPGIFFCLQFAFVLPSTFGLTRSLTTDILSRC